MTSSEYLVSHHLLVEGANNGLKEGHDRSFSHQTIELNQRHGPITVLTLQRFATFRGILSFQAEDDVRELNEVSIVKKRLDRNPLPVQKRTVSTSHIVQHESPVAVDNLSVQIRNGRTGDPTRHVGATADSKWQRIDGDFPNRLAFIDLPAKLPCRFHQLLWIDCHGIPLIVQLAACAAIPTHGRTCSCS